MLIGLLKRHDIRLLVDIRAFPRSRRYPQFNRGLLEDVLASREIGYHWAGDALGGYRKPRADSRHTALVDAAFRGFADYMESMAFRAAIEGLLERASSRRAAVMCAEADYRHCHRQLIADHLLRLGIEVRHILSEDECVTHRLHGCLDLEQEPSVYNKYAQGDLFATGIDQ
jgi:uncharacterized protein (DUF488 family)